MKTRFVLFIFAIMASANTSTVARAESKVPAGETISLSAGTPETGSDPECVSDAEREAIEARPLIYKEWTRDQATTEWRNCDNSNLAYRVLKTFSIMRKLGPLKDENPFDTVRIGEPWKFFVSRVEKLHIIDAGDPGCALFKNGNGAAAFASGPGEISICPSFGAHTYLYDVMILLHEARHAGNDGPGIDGMWPHVKCTVGYNKGVYGCDSAIDQDGAYAVSINAMLAFSRAETLSSALRQNMRAQAFGELSTRFNKMPDGTGLGVLLLRDTKQVDFWDGSNVSTLFRSIGKKTEIAATPGQLFLYHNDDYLGASYDGSGIQPVTYDNENLKIVSRNGKDGPLLDTVTANGYSCGLFKRLVACWNSDHSIQRVSFPINSDALRFFVLKDNAFKRSAEPDGVQVWIVFGVNGRPLRTGTTALGLPRDTSEYFADHVSLSSKKDVDDLVRDYTDVVGMPWNAPNNAMTSVAAINRASGQMSILSPPSVMSQVKVDLLDINIPGHRILRMTPDFFWSEYLERL